MDQIATKKQIDWTSRNQAIQFNEKAIPNPRNKN